MLYSILYNFLMNTSSFLRELFQWQFRGLHFCIGDRIDIHRCNQHERKVEGSGLYNCILEYYIRVVKHLILPLFPFLHFSDNMRLEMHPMKRNSTIAASWKSISRSSRLLHVGVHNLVWLIL